MEVQQMYERLLAGQVEMFARLEENMDSNQKKAEADRKADNQDLLTRMETIIDANQEKAEADKEDLLTKMKEDRKADQEELLARMDAMFDAHEKRMMACLGQAEAFREKMNATIQCIPSVVQETIHIRVENVGAELNQKTEANTEKIEQDTEMMQSAEEHQDVPSEDVTVMPVKGLKKWRRVRKSTAGRRGEPKEGTRGYYGSQRKVTVAGKRTSRHATVAWLKRKVFRRSGIQGNFGPCKEVTAARMRKSPEGNDGIRHRDVKVLPHLRKGRKMTNGIKG
jgi:hypothetical protein